MRTWLLLTLLPGVASATTFTDFTGDYAIARWSSTSILDGDAYVDTGASTTTEAVFVYDVDLGYPGPGVSFRTADYSVIAATDGLVSFDWAFDYDHRIHQPEVVLSVWAEGPGGVITETELHYDTASFGSESAAGMVVDVEVTAGRPFGITMGGGNLDADSRISGTVMLTDFVVESLEPDCAGTPGGTAELDMCGTCDSNPANDCTTDCNGVWGGGATVDLCGTCDSNPNNDCTMDCAGVFGGDAVEDMCGTCDSNPANDCTMDCNGVFGGAAQADMCGTCDEDATNDCTQDCHGDWGGTAYLDDCGLCVGGDTGDTPCVTTTTPTTGGSTTPTTGGSTTPTTGGSTTPSTGGSTTPTTGGSSTPTTGGSTPPTGTFDTAVPTVGDPQTFQRVGRGCGCHQGATPLPFLAWLAIPLIGWRRRR